MLVVETSTRLHPHTFINISFNVIDLLSSCLRRSVEATDFDSASIP